MLAYTITLSTPTTSKLLGTYRKNLMESPQIQSKVLAKCPGAYLQVSNNLVLLCLIGYHVTTAAILRGCSTGSYLI